MRVAAVVVTYNRKEELYKNIETVFNQTFVVDRYYVIDNHSDDHTKNYLRGKGVLDNKAIVYVYLPENIGGAGGFYTGLKKAYEDGYDYICLMDDDGRPSDKEMMRIMVEAADSIYRFKKEFIINALVCGLDGGLSFGLSGGIKTREKAMNVAEDGMIKGRINPFNGTLVSRELIETIGYPNKDFFIKGDEEDYYRRAKKADAFVATIVDAYYYHPTLERIKGRVFTREFSASTEAPWKEYYRARNYTYMFKRDGESIKYIRQNIRQIIWAVRYNPQRYRAVAMIVKGWRDGVLGRLGRGARPD